jgi:hypothetical protein
MSIDVIVGRLKVLTIEDKGLSEPNRVELLALLDHVDTELPKPGMKPMQMFKAMKGLKKRMQENEGVLATFQRDFVNFGGSEKKLDELMEEIKTESSSLRKVLGF